MYTNLLPALLIEFKLYAFQKPKFIIIITKLAFFSRLFYIWEIYDTATLEHNTIFASTKSEKLQMLEIEHSMVIM